LAIMVSRKTESFMVVGLFPISRREKSEQENAGPLTAYKSVFSTIGHSRISAESHRVPQYHSIPLQRELSVRSKFRLRMKRHTLNSSTECTRRRALVGECHSIRRLTHSLCSWSALRAKLFTRLTLPGSPA
jgi:hypothetical protein